MKGFEIRPVYRSDRQKIDQFIAEHWFAELVIVHDTIYKPSELPGFIASDGDEWLGLITYHIDGSQFEIVTLDSLFPSKGIGSALLQAVQQQAVEAGCKRLWLITTNDNLIALRFYQKRGFVLVAVHRNAVEKARVLKPGIPFVGEYGIPLRDEIELEKMLNTDVKINA